MYNPNIIEIRCKKCGRLYMKIELEGKVKFPWCIWEKHDL